MNLFYKIKEPHALRGWDGAPYALCTYGTGRTVFLNKHAYDVLSLCYGLVDFSTFLIPENFRETAEQLTKEGVIEQCQQPGQTVKPYQKYRLHPNKYIKTAHWSVTGRCNYKCRHCYMSAPEAKFGELSREMCLDIIDQLADCGVMNISITGGEALVRRDFFELLDRMLAYGMHITTIYSNGKLVTAGLLDALERRRIYPEFNISFDGIGWHDWLRGVKGAEQAALDAFRLCHERGFPTGAELCLHHRNKHTLRESVNVLAGVGVGHLKTNPASLSGAWIENAGGDNLSVGELFDIYLDYIPHFFADGAPLDIQLGGFFMARKGAKTYTLPAAKSDGRAATGKYCICGHARNVMYISADGRVLPCMSLSGVDAQHDFPLISELGLSACLGDSHYMRLIETTVDEFLAKNTGCADCENKYICAGGCRASALESGTGLMGPDGAACLFFKGGYAERVKAAAQGYDCGNYISK